AIPLEFSKQLVGQLLHHRPVALLGGLGREEVSDRRALGPVLVTVLEQHRRCELDWTAGYLPDAEAVLEGDIAGPQDRFDAGCRVHARPAVLVQLDGWVAGEGGGAGRLAAASGGGTVVRATAGGGRSRRPFG